MVDLDNILPHLMNNQGIIELFGSGPKLLTLNFSAMQLVVEKDALQLVLTTFDVPEKVKVKGATVMGIILEFSSVTEINYKGPIKENEEITWTIEQLESKFLSIIKSANGTIKIQYKHLILSNIGRRTELTFQW